MRATIRGNRAGNAVIEVALLAPWIFFLFVGVLDFGFYAYALISVENAARAATLLTSRSKVAATDQIDACAIVLSEMTWTAYGRNVQTNCQAAPLVVNTTLLNAGTVPASEDGSDAAQVDVQYTTLTMIPIPGVLPPSFVVDRKWQMKIDPSADY
ncbi:MAG TPA: TadE/TadG family type IV pilus assembly protein [Bryobacteraceae bacterium]|nr:TadE/TadG family type IV pilus assembly protein [Bryobacteraceae bacterium]